MNRLKLKSTLLLISAVLIFQGNLNSQTISDVLDNSISSVVTVAVYKHDFGKKMLGFRGEGISDVAYERALNLEGAKSSGSGFIIEKNGVKYVITNAHVIESASGEAGSIYAFTINRKQYELKVVGGDSFYDLAVLAFVTPPGNEVSTLKFKTRSSRLGEKVYAIGNPLGEYPYSVSDGIISAKNRVRDGATGKFGFLQTTATLIWGNSGGPLIDENGFVAGINSQIAFANTPGGDYIWQSQINFALESGIAERLINDILTNNGLVRRAYLGVEISMRYRINSYEEEATSEEIDSQPVIMAVLPGSPAENILAKFIGSSVISVNGAETTTTEEVLGEFEKLSPGQVVTLVLKTATVTKSMDIKSGVLSEKELGTIGKFVLDKNTEIIPDYSTPLVSFQLSSQKGIQYYPNGFSPQKKLSQGMTNKQASMSEPYTVVAAGVAGDSQEDMWMVGSLKDFGSIVKISALQGVLDFYASQAGSYGEEPSSFRQYISGDSEIIQKTVFY